jgi:P4 family phage/plasmid primase-like protien
VTHQATFQALYAAGIRELVCVIPPNAPLSPRSKIAPASRGKSPGRPNQEGEWGGYPWQTFGQPDLRTVMAWQQAGANIGLHAGTYPGIDIDVTREDLAAAIHAEAERALGAAPVRIGRAPKRLLMYRADVPFPKMQLRFRADDGVEHLVELLGQGQQYVIGGIHPATGEPYTIDRPVEDLVAALQPITREQATSFFEGLAETLEMLGCEIVDRSFSAEHAERLAVDQETLKGPSIEAVAKLVAATPNGDAFPHRDDYIRFGYAIKAACGVEAEGEALEIWMEWAARWEGAKDFDSDTAERDFLRMHAPFEIGWNYLLEAARRAGVATAEWDFDAKEAPEETPAERPSGVPMWSDMAMVNRILRAHGDEIMHVEGHGWYAWSGRAWEPDNNGVRVTQRVTSVLAQASGQALQEIEKANTADKVAMRLSSSNTVSAVRTLLASAAGIQRKAEHLDADHFLLNTPGGIVNLMSGELLPHRPDARMTKMTAVAPDRSRPASRWRQFLKEATGGDVELESYLQRLVGYSLTGSAREEMLAFFHGAGGNGKSLFLNVIREMLGPYAETAAMDTFTASTGDRHPTDMAKLRGARLVTASETQATRRWDEQRIKALTGNEDVTARFMRQDYFTFRPQFTLIVAGNHAPKIENVDDALMRRIHMVPFNRKPAKVDVHLKDKLREEYPSILAWAIEGAVFWFAAGLQPPDCVLGATREYLESEDVVLRWLAERTHKQENGGCLLTEAYADFRDWSRQANEQSAIAMSQQQFSKALASKGLAQHRDTTTGLRSVTGLALVADPAASTADFAALEPAVAQTLGDS